MDVIVMILSLLCGVALFMYGKYKREHKLDEFERYVESVEESCREQMEVFQ